MVELQNFLNDDLVADSLHLGRAKGTPVSYATMEVADVLKNAHLTANMSCQLSTLSAVKARDVDVVEAVVIVKAADELLPTLAKLILTPSLEL
jgi:hypothetical protein